MGLSATQMRFLMVTARKSNVEYQGQQINQARTALANQSSELYTELLSLKAPTAPSVYQYVITPTTIPVIDWNDSSSYPLTGTDLSNFLIHYAANEPSFQDFNIPEYVEKFDENGASIGWAKCLGKDDDGIMQYGPTVSTAERDADPGVFCYKTKGQYSTTEETTYLAVHFPADSHMEYNPETCMFQYQKGYETDANGTPLPLDKWFEAYNLAMSQYMTYTIPKRTAIYSSDEANLVNLEDNIGSNDPTPVSYYLYRDTDAAKSPSNNYNDAQYQAALTQYKAELEEYEKACAVINAKTEEIHEADKKLELQLKQLDTEQEAIQTEYEALKKVLEKNIENTYKTFG